MYSALTYDVMTSYLTKFVMAIFHGKQGLLCDLKKTRHIKNIQHQYLPMSFILIKCFTDDMVVMHTARQRKLP